MQTLIGNDVGFPDCAKRKIDVEGPKNGMKQRLIKKKIL